jgi:hypothetical protein
VGDIATCNTRALELGESITSGWWYRWNSNAGSTRYLGSSKSISFTQSVVDSLPNLTPNADILQQIFCDVVIRNSVGSTNGTDGVYFSGRYTTPTPTPSATPTPTPTSSPTITSSNISTVLGPDSSGDYLLNADLSPSSNAMVNVTINVSSPSLVEYVVIGLKPASSANFYDWGRANPSNSNATWNRSPQLPTVNPAPVCTDGVSSKVMWEVKYLVRLTNGSEMLGVLPHKIARVFTGAYCPSGLYPMFANSVSSTDGFKVQVTNFDSSFMSQYLHNLFTIIPYCSDDGICLSQYLSVFMI